MTANATDLTNEALRGNKSEGYIPLDLSDSSEEGASNPRPWDERTGEEDKQQADKGNTEQDVDWTLTATPTPTPAPDHHDFSGKSPENHANNQVNSATERCGTVADFMETTETYLFGRFDAEGTEKEDDKTGMSKLSAWFDKLPKDKLNKLEELAETAPDRLEAALDAALTETFSAEATPADKFAEIAASYTPYPKAQKLTVESIIAHLKDQLGPYLKAFSAPENYIYLNEFQHIEPQWRRMYDKLNYEHKKDEASPVLSDLVPPVSARVDKELETAPTDSKKSVRLGMAKKRREEKTENPAAAIG